MWYKGNKNRCEQYNAIVSYGENYEGIPNKDLAPGQAKKTESITESWSEIIEIEGQFYVAKHPDHEGAYLTEVVELPAVASPVDNLIENKNGKAKKRT